MAFIRRPNYWLCLAACAAAFWITLRVMAAPAVAARPTPGLTSNFATDFAEGVAEVRDPVLEQMIARFAREATEAKRRPNGR